MRRYHNLKWHFRKEIYKQFYSGKNEIKKGNGHYETKKTHNGATYDKIWSINSRKSLENSAKRVSIGFKKIGVTRISQINEESIKKYIIDSKKENISNGSLKEDLRFLNHFMIGTKNWNENNAITATKINKKYNQEIIGQKSSDISKQTYKSLNSKEWEDKQKIAYKHNTGVIEFIRNTGLRRSELNRYKLYKTNDGLEVLTIGKNGKVRFAKALNGGEKQVIKASDVKEKNIKYINNEQKKYLINKNHAQQALRHAEHVEIPKRIPSHIHRAYYGQQMLQELTNNDCGNFEYVSARGVHHNGNESYKIGEYKTTYFAAAMVSKYLGHNRLSVLNSYLGVGR